MPDQRKEWHEARRSAIGASEVAIVMGTSPWSSQAELWRKKMGMPTTPPPAAVQERMAMGTKLEPVVAELCAARRPYNHKLERWPQELVMRHPQWPTIPMSCTPDATIYVPSDGRAMMHTQINVQIKTAGSWADYVPAYYKDQVQAEMACRDLDQTILAVLVAGQRYVEHEVKRDDKRIAEIEAACTEWWRRYIVGNTCPEEYNADSADIILPPHAAEIWGRLDTVEEQLKELEDEKKGLKELVDEMLGGHASGLVPGVGTWYRQIRRRDGYSVPAGSYTVINRRKCR